MNAGITLSVLGALVVWKVSAYAWTTNKKHRDDYRQGYLLRVRYEAAVDTAQLLNHWYTLTPKGPEEDALVAEVLEVLAQRDAETLRTQATTEENRRKPGSWT